MSLTEWVPGKVEGTPDVAEGLLVEAICLIVNHDRHCPEIPSTLIAQMKRCPVKRKNTSFPMLLEICGLYTQNLVPNSSQTSRTYHKQYWDCVIMFADCKWLSLTWLREGIIDIRQALDGRGYCLQDLFRLVARDKLLDWFR